VKVQDDKYGEYAGSFANSGNKILVEIARGNFTAKPETKKDVPENHR